ncbi:class I SAM-dependent methyltransferase [Marinicrinis lubricantis]|uniref:Class I SAM-dependent methyltransferase n=1 Tax=Marinicrinis lubricantis TaxID=2086470 RepID=A0ABW1ITF9_9BACL
MSNTEKVYEQAGVAMTCRGYAEYEAMFHIQPGEFDGKTILDVAAGASSFAAESAERGWTVTAADPMYELPHGRIYKHGLKEIEQSTAKLRRIQDVLDMSFYGNLETHQRQRYLNLERFLNDYRKDVEREKRTYVASALPHLSFPDEAFDVVLCSHFLFLYADQFSEQFHAEALRELVRVCRGQVRIYPLVSLQWESSSYLDALLARLEEQFPVKCERLESRLPFIPGSNTQLCISRLE